MRVPKITPQAYVERAEVARALFSKIALPEPELDKAPVARHGVLYPHKLDPYDLWAVRYEEPKQTPVLAGIYATEGAAKYAAAVLTDTYMWNEGVPVTATEQYIARICEIKAKINRPGAVVHRGGTHTYVITGFKRVRIDHEKIEPIMHLPNEVFVAALLCAGNFEPYAKKDAP